MVRIKLIIVFAYLLNLMLCTLGYMVIMPDFYRNGEWCDPTSSKTAQFLTEKSKWDIMKSDWEAKILPFAESKGAKIFGAIGEHFCIFFMCFKVSNTSFQEHAGAHMWCFDYAKASNSKLESHFTPVTHSLLNWLMKVRRTS